MTLPPVTRHDARRIAEDYLKAHPRPNCDGIEKVFTIPELEEFMIRRPCFWSVTGDAPPLLDRLRQVPGRLLYGH
jgi:hypothetical protein